MQKIEKVGVLYIIPSSIEQNENIATVCKRRKPHQSEISISDIQNLTATQLHDKIRSLDDPYPNAFIKCQDGSKLYIKKTYL